MTEYVIYCEKSRIAEGYESPYLPENEEKEFSLVRRTAVFWHQAVSMFKTECDGNVIVSAVIE